MQREKEIHEIEVHVSALCLDDSCEPVRILIGKRADDRLIFPGYWECGGGQVHVGETLLDAVTYHMNEEFGLQVQVLMPFTTYNIDLKEKLIPGIRFLCRCRCDDIVTLDKDELVDFRWIEPSKLVEFNFIPGLVEDIERGLNVFSSVSRMFTF